MDKINSQIQKNVSIILNRFSENLNFPVVNFVDTSKDLSNSRIFIGFSSENPQREFRILSKKFGQIQEEFAQLANFRKTPHLTFILDTKQENINKVEEIIENISK